MLLVGILKRLLEVDGVFEWLDHDPGDSWSEGFGEYGHRVLDGRRRKYGRPSSSSTPDSSIPSSEICAEVAMI